MKKLVIVLFILCLGTVSANTQVMEELMPRQYTQAHIDSIAKLNTDFLCNLLKLSDEQKQDVHDLYVKRLVSEANAKTGEELVGGYEGYLENLNKILNLEQIIKYRELIQSRMNKSVRPTLKQMKQSSKRNVKQMKKRLGLSDEQQQKWYNMSLRRMIEVAYNDFKIRGVYTLSAEEHAESVRQILTPEQWVKYQNPPTIRRETPLMTKEDVKLLYDLQKQLDIAAEKKQRKQQKEIERAAKKQQKQLDKRTKIQ